MTAVTRRVAETADRKAPHDTALAMSAFAVAIGVKRTCHFALHMSANDPKRTSDLNGRAEPFRLTATIAGIFCSV
jgi:hypothetical protein